MRKVKAKSGRLRRRLAVAGVLTLAVATTASCGTRLPDSAFAPFVINPSSGTQTYVQGSGQSAAGGSSYLGSSGLQTGQPGDSGATAPIPTSTSTNSLQAGPNQGGTGAANPGSGASGSAGHPAAAKNFASDRGVTATSISVCNVVTLGGPFGVYQFTPSYYGAAAYFAALNAQGGINGRTVNFTSHPDDGSDSGDLQEVRTCVDREDAFAFVANDIYEYAGAPYTHEKNIPDIGGQPISTYYYQLPNLFPIDGFHQPRDGKTLGLDGYGYRTDEDALYFKDAEHIAHVGVIYYDQASSEYGANVVAGGFKAAGMKVSMYSVNLGLPNFASAVAQMKADGVDMVADALDLNGSQKFCQAVEQNTPFLNQMKIKLTTTGGWDQSIGSDFSQTPSCAAKTWADAFSVNFDDTSNPQVAQFQAAMHKNFPSEIPHNAQFALEGWIAAMWFTDAAKSCGADLTRVCVENYMNRKENYDARGLLVPNVGYSPEAPSFYAHKNRLCVSIAQWSNPSDKWITRAEPSRDCYDATGYRYQLTSPT